jgi:putative FmdB family regulatory protein
MPIYEFICQECKHIFELLAIKEGDLVEIKCPTCGADNLERVMSKVTVTSGGGNSGKKQTPVENRSCFSGTCSTITLPGHTK